MKKYMDIKTFSLISDKMSCHLYSKLDVFQIIGLEGTYAVKNVIS